MKKKELGITKGKATTQIIDIIDFKSCTVGSASSNKVICHIGFGNPEVTSEDKANAALIADAFNTANKCGFLPSELLEQRGELLHCVKALYDHKESLCEWQRIYVETAINQIEQ